jgi:ADP-ribose pyrophosphatase
MRWEVTSSDIMYHCRIFRVRRDRSRSLSSGETHEFHVLEAGDWVNVIPVTTDRRVVLVRQFRHGIRDLTLEVPAGLIDAADASPAAAAVRELREETGYAGGHLVALGAVHPNPAIMNNRCHVFAAHGVELIGAPQWDHTEELAVETVPLDEIADLMRGGRITNALTLVAFQLLHLSHLDPAP